MKTSILKSCGNIIHSNVSLYIPLISHKEGKCLYLEFGDMGPILWIFIATVPQLNTILRC